MAQTVADRFGERSLDFQKAKVSSKFMRSLVEKPIYLPICAKSLNFVCFLILFDLIFWHQLVDRIIYIYELY